MFERSIGCRDIRREIEDAGQDRPLSLEASSHLRSCGPCEKLFDQHLKLSQIVGSLGTVAAPNDFEFRLRARLAGEKRSASHAASTGYFSFGLRAAAFASIVLLVGFVLAIVLRPGTDGSSPDVAQGDAKPVVSQPGAEDKTSKVVVNDGNQSADSTSALSGVNQGGSTPPASRRNGSRGGYLATAGNRSGRRDIGQSSAPVVRIDDLVAADGHTVFPIDAAPQSVKVSLDNGRGTPKTISVPGVSFGSQRTLNQNSSPLVASSRGAW